MMDEKRLARAVELVAQQDKAGAQILGSWLQLLPPEAGPNIASALSTATRGDVIGPLAHAALLRFGTARAFLEDLLRRGSSGVALGLLAQLGAIEAVRPRAELAASALDHGEPRVRAEAMRIVPIEPHVALHRLGPLLDDPDPQLRMTAADALSSCTSIAEPAALALIRSMSGPGFEEREREELIVFYRALGRLQSTTGHSFLAERLSHPKKGFLKKKRSEQEQLLAVQGLGEEATLRALRILEEATVPGRDHPPSVVNACRAAVQRIRTPRASRRGTPS
jgi:HEAT repeat protein